MTDEDVTNLLALRIRRISAYDREKNRGEIDDIDGRLAEIAEKLEHLTRTVIATLEDYIERYGDQFPRRTRTESFESIDVRAVSNQSIKLHYDPKTGFLGSQVKGGKPMLTVSEFDLVLGIANDGSYRVMPPPEKILFTGKLLHCEKFDPETGAGFTVVYRDKGRTAYGKRIKIEKFIRNREYQLIKDKAGKVDLLLAGDETGQVSMQFVPAPRQRVRTAKYDLSKLETTGVTARGVRLAPKPVSKLKFTRAGGPKRRKPAKPGPPKPGGSGNGTQSSLF